MKVVHRDVPDKSYPIRVRLRYQLYSLLVPLELTGLSFVTSNVDSSTSSCALNAQSLKMPDIATKPRSVDDILEIISATKSITCKLPPARPTSFSNTKLVTDSVPASPSSSPSLSLSSQVKSIQPRNGIMPHMRAGRACPNAFCSLWATWAHPLP